MRKNGLLLIAIVFLIEAVIFFLVKAKKIETTIVLTDKRIYTNVVIAASGLIEKSYNLNKIDSYAFYELKEGGRLKISTSSSNATFIIDKEFYGEFVNAINSKD